jgi:PhnB protein
MSDITVNPYLFFRGDCREAMDFYKSIFGGELELLTYANAGIEVDGMAPEMLMHAQLSGGDILLMASDTTEASERAAKVSISLGGTNEAKLRAIFEGLSEGVEVKNPLKKEGWGDIFGSVTDKYHIEWMVNISQQTAA